MTACSSSSPPKVDNAGNYVTFGDFDGDPVKWRVLDVDGDKALIITTDIFETYGTEYRPLGFDEGDTLTWENSGFRSYCNSSFLKQTFSEKQIEFILFTDVVNDGGNDTLDRVFLLSIDEAYEYFYSDDDRKADGHADSNVYFPADEWALRSPRSDVQKEYPAYVTEDGAINEGGVLFDDNPLIIPGNIGIRPAMWVKLGS
jgi:hypothetical protein